MTPKVEYDYDKEGDVLYISFGTGEPSFCDNLNDFILIEFGIYSGLPTGMRMLDVRHRGIQSVRAAFSQIEPVMQQKGQEVMGNRLQAVEAFRNRLKDMPDLNSIFA